MYIKRLLESAIKDSLEYFPVVAITGPRQCGKSTLAKALLEQRSDSIYLDLERPSDIARLQNAEIFLTSQKGKLICIDEVQRMPELFPLIRSLVDEWGQPGAFLILGSASRDTLRQSSETLAGRIAYHRLTAFLWDEISAHTSVNNYLASGAFPGSILAKKPEQSYNWRSNFIATFLERDLLSWRGVSPVAMRRLWTMLAHNNGQTVNYSRLAGSLGVSDNTVRNYIELLTSTYMVEAVLPHHSNVGKRLVKAPKIYPADTGIVTALLGLHTFEDALGHPGYGALWEQLVLANLRGYFPDAEITHYRSAGQAEIDFVMGVNGQYYAIECKASAAPALSRGNYSALEDIAPQRTFIVAPVQSSWQLSEQIEVINVQDLKNI